VARKRPEKFVLGEYHGDLTIVATHLTKKGLPKKKQKINECFIYFVSTRKTSLFIWTLLVSYMAPKNYCRNPFVAEVAPLDFLCLSRRSKNLPLTSIHRTFSAFNFLSQFRVFDFLIKFGL